MHFDKYGHTQTHHMRSCDPRKYLKLFQHTHFANAIISTNYPTSLFRMGIMGFAYLRMTGFMKMYIVHSIIINI